MTHSSSTWGRKCNLAPGRDTGSLHLANHRFHGGEGDYEPRRGDGGPPGKQHLPAHRLASTQEPHPNPPATVCSCHTASQLRRINYSTPVHISRCLEVYFIFTLQFYVPRTRSSLKYSTGMKSSHAHNPLNEALSVFTFYEGGNRHRVVK